MTDEINEELEQEEKLVVTDKFEASKKDIIDILAGNIPAMGALLRILEIRPSDEIETACVSATGSPTLYYNPNFVNEHCESKAHMAMLLLHEIYHVLLGHTLKGKVTQEDNLVADAIINAMICQQYGSVGYQSFFMNFYDREKMPEAILRPKARPKAFWRRRKYKQLYTPMGMPWDDIKELVRDTQDEETKIVLLGTHGDASGGAAGQGLPDVILDTVAEGVIEHFAQDVQEEINKEIRKLENEKWNEERKQWADNLTQKEKEEIKKKIDDISREIGTTRNAGIGSSIFVSTLQRRLEASKKKRELEEELRKVAQQSLYSKLEAKLKGLFPKIPEKSVLPNYRNRKAIVNLAAGIYQPFYDNPLRPRDFGQVTIYIDVSGSMNGYIGTVYKLCCNCKEYLNEDIYLFSNDVRTITKEQLLKGVRETTYGTDDCFLEHALEHKHRKILVFTDGYLHVSQRNIDEAKRTKTMIVAAYTPQHGELPEEIIHSGLVMEKDGSTLKKKKGG